MGWASRHELLARAVNRNLGGVPVIWGAVSGEGIFEQNSELVLNGDVISLEYVVHNLPTSLFGGLSYDDVVSVDGDTYTVREPMKMGDGAYMMVSLSKAVVALNRLLLEAGGVLLTEDGYALLQEG